MKEPSVRRRSCIRVEFEQEFQRNCRFAAFKVRVLSRALAGGSTGNGEQTSSAWLTSCNTPANTLLPVIYRLYWSLSGAVAGVQWLSRQHRLSPASAVSSTADCRWLPRPGHREGSTHQCWLSRRNCRVGESRPHGSAGRWNANRHRPAESLGRMAARAD